ncbi:5-formyltetrahydrofolate cyclo-ligase [Micrococcus luteus]|uniref:5-formyltetrahydrofolate cyclo-ligase n=1 Tax=Micrococcus luteus TaxID=1270 RepID=UPI0030CA2CF4
MSAAVSVVVPYYRAQADLDRLTAALAAQRGLTGGLQLVVADDGSPVPPRVDPGLPFDVVTVRQQDRGFRASAARALGAEAADGDVLAFLDGDMLPEPGYLAAALAAAAAVVMPALAVAEDGMRLGQGGGYYDRFLAELPQAVPTVALVFEDELLPAGAIPAEPTDRPVDGVVTAAGLHWV